MSFTDSLPATRTLVISAGVLVPLLLAAAVVTFSSVKKVSPVSWGWFGAVNNADGLALQGYDAVAYLDGDVALGDAAYAVDWNGVTWRFASAEHKAAFEAQPEAFAPQFGGYCAFAVSKGFTADTDPSAFAVAGDKLYVFADSGVRDSWVDGLETTRQASEASWAAR